MSMIGYLLRVTDEEIAAYLADSSLLEDRIYSDEAMDDPDLIDIDKSWAGILFLLTGQGLDETEHLLTKVFFSGQEFDEELDQGYGVPQYLTAAQVKVVNAELSRLTTDELSGRYDPERMWELDIYPGIWDDETALDYLLQNFEEVQEVYSTAARNNEGMIVYLS